jgi:hypothetical protein
MFPLEPNEWHRPRLKTALPKIFKATFLCLGDLCAAIISLPQKTFIQQAYFSIISKGEMEDIFGDVIDHTFSCHWNGLK